MKLISASVHGYKRFANLTSMNLGGKLIAVVGPNESGKSSFLEALTQLNHGEPLITTGGSQQTTRNISFPGDQYIVSAIYLLDDDDREALRNIHGGSKVQRFKISKIANGEFYSTVSPPPQRSLEPRKRTLRELNKTLSKRGFLKLAERQQEVDLKSDIGQVVVSLSTESNNILSENLEGVKALAEVLESALSEEDPKYLQKLVNQLRNLVEHETGDPHQQAIDIIFERRPEFLLFTEQERLLQPEYNLDQVWQQPPAALRNLARVAELDLQKLHSAIQTGDTAQVATIRATANERLTKVFASSWFQSNIAVGFDTDGLVLRIFVTEDKTKYTSIAERSDGLRQFVALLAFATLKQSQKVPILLIDEAETHLHYDAQADLVQMLTRQEIVSKVIYTTHSIGCLPEDLGTGVRLIGIDAKDNNISRVQNWFWKSDRPGFSPLLFGMGATTLSFIPIRNAVVVEGIVDTILWPTLLREATQRSYLDFQVVPGASESCLK